MRRLLACAALLVLVSDLPVLAGIPGPDRSTWSLKGQGSPCQFRFRGDGSLDCLTLCVTLRDAFDAPVPFCPTTATVSLVGPKPASGCWASEAGDICSCDGFARSGTSDASGVLSFEWCQIGGRGIGQVCITANCVGSLAIGCEEFNFTSHDLFATCSPNSTILNMAIWVACLPPSPACQSSDYDCSCTVDVLDLAIWAGGIGRNCMP